jgi:hypothetical protein
MASRQLSRSDQDPRQSQAKTKRRPDACAAERRRAAPDTRPGKISANKFRQVRAIQGNGLRSRERRFESCRGHPSQLATTPLASGFAVCLLSIMCSHVPPDVPRCRGSRNIRGMVSEASAQVVGRKQESPGTVPGLLTSQGPVPCVRTSVRRRRRGSGRRCGTGLRRYARPTQRRALPEFQR